MYNNTQQNPYMYGYYPQPQQRGTMFTQNDGQSFNANHPYPAAQMTQQINYIKGRPVVSIDEARASQIDLDGSLYVFPDLSNKKIYTKQINMDGTASFNIFELSGATGESLTPTYVTKEELNDILTKFKLELNQDKNLEANPAQVKAQINKAYNL